MIRKKFIVIDSTYRAVKNQGYKLDFISDCAHYNTSYYPDGYFSLELQEVTKDFNKLDDTVLCKDEKDEYYAVLFMNAPGLEDEPVLWQKVIKE